MANRLMINGGVAEKQTAGSSASSSAAQERHGSGVARRGASSRFYVCVVTLLAAAAGMQSMATVLGGYFRKAPVPLKRSLDALDQTKLLPEYATHRIQPAPLDTETVASLGTEEYLQWNLSDRQRAPEETTSRVRLFITYYTGQPDPVPHNPKECLAAGGMTLKEETLIETTASSSDGVNEVIPVSVLEFELPQRSETLRLGGNAEAQRLVVVFFFYANGRYLTSRTGVRAAVSNLWDRYAYYSKIELSFTDDTGGTLASREETIIATRRLLKKLMPILWEDHYQDWEELKNGAPPVEVDQ